MYVVTWLIFLKPLFIYWSPSPLAKDDIEVSLDNGVLSISGEKKVEKETGKDSKVHRTERFHGTFLRRFTLPSAIDADRVNADYKDGVLSLSIPKVETENPKKIDIKFR